MRSVPPLRLVPPLRSVPPLRLAPPLKLTSPLRLVSPLVSEEHVGTCQVSMMELFVEIVKVKLIVSQKAPS